MGINKRVELRKFVEDIQRWVEEGRSDDWIASALGTSPSSVQSFRSRNAIYRRGATSTLQTLRSSPPTRVCWSLRVLGCGSTPRSARTRAGRKSGEAPRG